jgi:hypothetical protein
MAACGVCGPLGDACSLTAGHAEHLSQGQLHALVANLTQTHAFFRYFRANLEGVCPQESLDAEGLCTSPDCAVQTCADGRWWDAAEHSSDVTGACRQLNAHLIQDTSGLGQSRGDGVGGGEGTVQEEQHKALLAKASEGAWEMPTAAYCVPDEEHTPHHDLQVVDLHSNPERFTGFSGDAAHAIWRAVYDSNCFVKSSAWLQRGGGDDEGEGTGNLREMGLLDEMLPWETHAPGADDAASPAGPVVTAQDTANMCLEERVVYRLLSGMHSSVSLHICHGYPTDHAAQSVARPESPGAPLSPQRAFSPNLQEFLRRFSNETTDGQGGEWLRNLYFAYATVLRAVQRADVLWEKYPFHAAPLEDPDSPGAVGCRAAVRRLLTAAAEACPSDVVPFDETQLFRGGDAQEIQKELRDHFRHVSRVMDCVGCLKCRLWGKLQVRGLATALRILTARPAELAPNSAAPLAVVREDVVALFRTLERLSASIGYLRNFDAMMHAA